MIAGKVAKQFAKHFLISFGAALLAEKVANKVIAYCDKKEQEARDRANAEQECETKCAPKTDSTTLYNTDYPPTEPYEESVVLRASESVSVEELEAKHKVIMEKIAQMEKDKNQPQQDETSTPKAETQPEKNKTNETQLFDAVQND